MLRAYLYLNYATVMLVLIFSQSYSQSWATGSKLQQTDRIAAAGTKISYFQYQHLNEK